MNEVIGSEIKAGAFQIQLPQFEGPLDLLLHLIRKHELEISELPIAFITEKYLAYLELMKQLNLDLASEYLVMAATLAHLKSRTLVPTHEDLEEESEDGEQGDPRTELIQRLLEYQKYKEVSERLGEKPVAGRDVFPRGSEAPRPDGPAPLAEIGLFKLLDAFAGVLQRAKADLTREIEPERISVQHRIAELTDMLRERGICNFAELFRDNVPVYDLVVTFLAVLEMAKMRLLRLAQAEPVSPIQLELAFVQEPEAETPQ
ncbi:MAG: segregation/condensation protein A [Myxococcales bacterium]|nr:MAG: segregation/condensation protein A [Myxococcales bacterium]